jgi:hypothetical protein
MAIASSVEILELNVKALSFSSIIVKQIPNCWRFLQSKVKQIVQLEIVCLVLFALKAKVKLSFEQFLFVD